MTFTRAAYEWYIASDEWAAVRRRVLRKRGAVCQSCGTVDALHVHHHTYARFTREHDDDLTILCGSCHRIVHRLHDGQRFRKGPTLTLTEVTFAFLRSSTGAAYSDAVMRNHTPLVPSKPARTDGKRVVSMSRADRGGRGRVDLNAIKAPGRVRKERGR